MNSEKERKRPSSQAELIPENIWENIFLNNITKEQITLMKTPLDDFLNNQALIQFHKSCDEKAQAAWVCLAIGSPKKSDDELLEVGRLLALSIWHTLSLACSMGRLSLIEKILEGMHRAEVFRLLKQSSYQLYSTASTNGYLEVMRYFEAKLPLQIEAMIRAGDYAAYLSACEKGYLNILQHLEEKLPTLLKATISIQKNETYRKPGYNLGLEITQTLPRVENIINHGYLKAAKNGHLDVMKHLQAIEPKGVESMIDSSYQQAYQNGHLDIMQYLEDKKPTLLDSLSLNFYEPYRVAAFNGYLNVMQYLEVKRPLLIEEMIKASDYFAYRMAAYSGHLNILQHIEEIAPALVNAMTEDQIYFAYCKACENGHLDVVQHIETRTPEPVTAMIKTEDYAVYRTAARNNHLEMMKHFEAKSSSLVVAMLEARTYEAYRKASENGHLEVIKHIEEIAPDLAEKMITSLDYYAYRWASENGHLNIMQHIEEKQPSLVEAMIRTYNYSAYYFACKKGHLEVVQHLETKLPLEVDAMISTKDYRAFREATHDRIINKLLSHPCCFAYAEMHTHQDLIHSVILFIEDKITELRNRRQEIENNNRNAVFDLSDHNEAKLCFYMIRNIIRGNNRRNNVRRPIDPMRYFDRLNELRFLIGIPAVRALLHTAVTPQLENELFRLAITTGNREAADILLTVPAIRTLAEANHLYRNEARVGLDLHQLARDHESSMRALTTGEQKRLQRAIDAYQPTIQEKGTSNLMMDLRAWLIARYEKKPAMTTDVSESCALPVHWEEFQQLNLAEEGRKKALQTYYQHKDHTAWRYLLKPNPWMSRTAAYVEVNPNNSDEHYSTFEEYQPLIVMLWLAASDKNVPPTDGQTFEGRLDHFVDELAHIGRAHNWDNTRYKTNKNGKRILDENRNPILEEYDDLDGDKPSCYSGVKRRLFQSVVGHPFLKILTMDDVKQEFHDFIRQHFIKRINELNATELQEAYFAYIESIDFKDASPLQALDIMPKDKEAFIEYLKTKYGEQFTDESSFKQYIEKELELRVNKGQPVDYAHALKFDGEVNLQQLLETAKHSKHFKLTR
ncbi:MAG: hypothetical protein JSS53_02835 [Proteobacteria bacterium]|nr:hypothetical protein [Pseudomonadota bacterium]